MPFSKDSFKSAFSVDNVIFAFDQGKLQVLLIKRAEEPFKNQWALPGALVNIDENLRDAPMRTLKELTGLEDVFLEQVFTFGKVDRHPKGRVITVAYYSLINKNAFSLQASSFAQEVKWLAINDIDSLAFDHYEIMMVCLRRLQESVRRRPIGFELLPETFTLSDVQDLYEAILHKELDKRNFRKKILSLKILDDINEYQQNVAHRPAKLYKFNIDKYEQFKDRGFNFEI